MARIAILTNFKEFNPGYSLTGIVLDQRRMLLEHGNSVTLFTATGCTPPQDPSIDVKPIIPDVVRTDYQSVNEIGPNERGKILEIVQALCPVLKDYDFVFTHDWVFTGWNLLHGMSCRAIGKMIPHLRWLHWIHSIPTAMKDWWIYDHYGPAHRLVYPNEADRVRVAEAYRGPLECVRVIPHIKDLRCHFDFSEDSCKFIHHFPNLMQADIVQVYPCSADRLEAKGLHHVIGITAALKKIGFSVFLAIVNQWATGANRRDDIRGYIDMAEKGGLVQGKDFIFTSLYKAPAYEVGLSKTFLREITQCSNLFVFPTREETFGLVLPEASLTAGSLCVLNQSLRLQGEIAGYKTIMFNFGAYDQVWNCDNLDRYHTDIASIIAGRMEQSESIKLRTWVRQRYNYDFLYGRYYLPIMAEASRWA